MNSPPQGDFVSDYMALNEQLGNIYEEFRVMKTNNYRNNEKLGTFQQIINKASRELDRLRETYHGEYEIHELIKSVETSHQYLLDDIRDLYKKPRAMNKIPNFGITQPRRSSFSGFERWKNRFKKMTQRRRKSFGGTYRKQTRKS
jgi:hypothetical protein